MRNACIDWFRAVRVFLISWGHELFHGGESVDSADTLLRREPNPSSYGGRGSGLCGRGRLHSFFRDGTVRLSIWKFSTKNFSLFLLISLFIIYFTPVNASTPAVTAIRIGEHVFGLRIVLDVSGTASYSVKSAKNKKKLIISFPKIDWFPSTIGSSLGNWLIKKYEFDIKGNTGGELALYSSVPIKILKSFMLSPSGKSGHRLVFDLAETPDALPVVADLRRNEQSMNYGTHSIARTEPSPQVPTINLNEAEKNSRSLDAVLMGAGKDPLLSSKNLQNQVKAKLIGDEEKRFTLKTVRVDDVTVKTGIIFKLFYQKLIGKMVSLKQLKEVTKAMTAEMRNKGYLLYKFIIPEQEINAGQVRFQAIEGFISDVVIEGDLKGREDLWKGWSRKIRASRPIKSDVLERYSLLANDLAGITVKTVLRASKSVPGASDLILKITEKSVDASISIDNRASTTTGPEQMTAVLGLNNIFSLAEKISISYNTVKEFKQQATITPKLEIPINTEGTTAIVSGSMSKSRPGGDLEALELNSDTLKASVSISHPIIRQRNETLRISGGFNYTNAISKALGSLLYEDTIKTLNSSLNYKLKDKFEGDNTLNLGLVHGIGWLVGEQRDASLLSRSNGDGSFSKLTLGANRAQKMPKNFGLSINISGQWASEPLLSSEEFSFGGSSLGRAYDSSEITGDHGMGIALELKYTFQPEGQFLKYLQPYTFWDFGVTWDLESEDDERQQSAASAGMGIRLGFGDYLSADLEVSQPLTRPVSSASEGDGGDPRVFFNLSGNY